MKSKASCRRHLTLTILSLSLLFAAELCAREGPGSHPDYVQGRRALKEGRLEPAVESFIRAISKWEEDGEATRVSSRWPEPYLPRFYLGKALHLLGCHQQAIEQFDLSILNREEVNRGKKIEKQMETLLLEAEQALRKGGIEKLLLEAEQALRKGKMSERGSYCKTWEQKISQATPGGTK